MSYELEIFVNIPILYEHNTMFICLIKQCFKLKYSKFGNLNQFW